MPYLSTRVLPRYMHPISPSSWKGQQTAADLQKFFWCVSLYGVPTYAAQPQNVRQINTCVLLVKNPSSHVLSHACFSRTSFLLCLLQLNIPSRVCPSKTPFKRLSKEPLSFYFMESCRDRQGPSGSSWCLLRTCTFSELCLAPISIIQFPKC